MGGVKERGREGPAAQSFYEGDSEEEEEESAQSSPIKQHPSPNACNGAEERP